MELSFFHPAVMAGLTVGSPVVIFFSIPHTRVYLTVDDNGQFLLRSFNQGRPIRDHLFAVVNYKFRLFIHLPISVSSKVFDKAFNSPRNKFRGSDKPPSKRRQKLTASAFLVSPRHCLWQPRNLFRGSFREFVVKHNHVAQPNSLPELRRGYIVKKAAPDVA